MLVFNLFYVFHRRDSFITHRAFCDALAHESAKPQPATSVIVSGSEGTVKAEDVMLPLRALPPSSPPPPLTPSTGVLSPVLSIQSSGDLTYIILLYSCPHCTS